MKLKLGKKFWIAVTFVIAVLTAYVVARNLVHAVTIKRQISALAREESYYREKIAQDSALLERLKYDDFLEEYAREHFHMQGPGERVYILKE